MKKVLKHLVRAREALARADMEIGPRTPGRDAVAPWLHTTMTYLESTIVGAESQRQRQRQRQRGLAATPRNVFGFEKVEAIA